jgi:hypothetical protein
MANKPNLASRLSSARGGPLTKQAKLAASVVRSVRRGRQNDPFRHDGGCALGSGPADKDEFECDCTAPARREREVELATFAADACAPRLVEAKHG